MLLSVTSPGRGIKLNRGGPISPLELVVATHEQNRTYLRFLLFPLLQFAYPDWERQRDSGESRDVEITTRTARQQNTHTHTATLQHLQRKVTGLFRRVKFL